MASFKPTSMATIPSIVELLSEEDLWTNQLDEAMVGKEFGPVNAIADNGDGQSWALRNDGRLMHDNREQHNQQSTQAQPVQEGDVIGVTFDHVELRFLVNNRPLEACLTGIKGRQLFPVVFVDDGAILDVFFDGFQHKPPAGFDRILVEKSLL